jgi:tRNA uridine 5-carboxymethylaminomethyl modification enzyme
MFTSRSEYRLTLRADNADLRLTGKGIAVGCVSTEREKLFKTKIGGLGVSRGTLKVLTITPNHARTYQLPLNQDGIRRTAYEMLSYPSISFEMLARVWPELSEIPQDIQEQLTIETLYAGYLDRQSQDIDLFKREEGTPIPTAINYDTIPSLSNEIRAKLKLARPATIGAAHQIQGMTPAAITILLGHLRRLSAKAA